MAPDRRRAAEAVVALRALDLSSVEAPCSLAPELAADAAASLAEVAADTAERVAEAAAPESSERRPPEPLAIEEPDMDPDMDPDTLGRPDKVVLARPAAWH